MTSYENVLTEWFGHTHFVSLTRVVTRLGRETWAVGTEKDIQSYEDEDFAFQAFDEKVNARKHIPKESSTP